MNNARRMFLAMVINCAALLHVVGQLSEADSLEVIRLHCQLRCSTYGGAFVALRCAELLKGI